MLFVSKVSKVQNGRVYYVDGGNLGRDLKSFDECVEVVGEMMSYPENKGKTFLPVDRGDYVWPRFTVIEFCYKVGDEVSMGFNGDYYPQGKISKISKDFRIVTLENGKRFFRNGHKKGEGWKFDKTWFLVNGIHNERNPSF